MIVEQGIESRHPPETQEDQRHHHPAHEAVQFVADAVHIKILHKFPVLKQQNPEGQGKERKQESPGEDVQ